MVQYVPESKAFAELRELETKLDTMVAEKAAEFSLSSNKNKMERRTLLLSLYNLHSGQSATTPFGTAKRTDPPSWTLRLEGALVPKKDENGNNIPEANPGKLSTFFTKVMNVVEADPIRIVVILCGLYLV